MFRSCWEANSADTAGNRVRATTKEQLFARFAKWSAQARAAYDRDGSTDLATLIARANDDFGQAEPARFAASAFAANGSPVYLYRFSYVQTAMREMLPARMPHGGEIAFVFGTVGTGGFGPTPPPPTPQDRAVSRIAQSYWVKPGPAIRMVRACQLGRVTIGQGFDLRIPFRWLGRPNQGRIENVRRITQFY